MAVALVTCTRWEVAIPVERVLSADSGKGQRHVIGGQGAEETQHNTLKKSDALCATSVVVKVILPEHDCQDVDEVGTEQSTDADSDLFGLDWRDEPGVSINAAARKIMPSAIESCLTMCARRRCATSLLWRRP